MTSLMSAIGTTTTFILGYNDAPPTITYSCSTISVIWLGSLVHNLSVVCCCFQQWSVEHSHTCRPGSGWPCSTDACQDRGIVRAVVAASTASREEIQTHLLHHHGPLEPPACSKTLITCASGQDTTYTITSPSMATLVSWKSRLECEMALCCLQWWE